MCVYTYMCVFTHICLCVYTDMCVYVYICIMYMCMCVYVHVNKWFYNILGGIFYSWISQILLSNTTNITHGSIYDHYYKRHANETIMFFGSKIDVKKLAWTLYTSSTLFLPIIAFSCCATQFTNGFFLVKKRSLPH